jgi:hypothetical protein
LRYTVPLTTVTFSRSPLSVVRNGVALFATAITSAA